MDIKASYWDSTARSAFEFARQMSSPRLVKANPLFKCSFEPDTERKQFVVPTVVATYVDNSTLQLDASEYTALEMRSVLFQKASDVEIQMEIAEADPPEDA